MRRFMLLALCLCMVEAVSGELRITSTEFNPPEFVPGDKVSVVARFDPAGLPWDDVRMEEGFPEPDDTEPLLLSVAVERRSGAPVLVVVFMPWKAGRARLPALSIGGLSFPAIPFETLSAIGSDLSPPHPRPQLEPSGLRARVYVASGLLLAIAVLIMVFVSVVLPWFRKLMIHWSFARTRREFDARLALLNGATEAGPDEWALLCSSLRWFLEVRTSLPWRSMTPSESEIIRDAMIDPGLAKDVSSILRDGDEIRFACRKGPELPSALACARDIADRLDTAMTSNPVRRASAGGRG